MIQRVQTLYYLLAVLCLLLSGFGMSVYVFTTEEAYYILNGFGISKFSTSNQLLEFRSTPYYLVAASMVMLLTIAILAYKNLSLQLKLGRAILLLYLVAIVLLLMGSFLGFYFTLEKELTRGLGLGFFAFVIGFAFVFLGNVGVKRDKNLLDSMDRLR